eukprot:UN17050
MTQEMWSSKYFWCHVILMVVLIILTNLMTYNYANSQCAGATSKIHSEDEKDTKKSSCNTPRIVIE